MSCSPYVKNSKERLGVRTDVPHCLWPSRRHPHPYMALTVMLRSEGESIPTHASNLLICSFNIMENQRQPVSSMLWNKAPVIWKEEKWPPVARQMHNGSFVKEEIAKHNKEWPESEARTQETVSGTRRMGTIHPEKAGPRMDTVRTSDCLYFPLSN